MHCSPSGQLNEKAMMENIVHGKILRYVRGANWYDVPVRISVDWLWSLLGIVLFTNASLKRTNWSTIVLEMQQLLRVIRAISITYTRIYCIDNCI